MTLTLWDFDHIYTVGDVAATGKIAPECLVNASSYATPYQAVAAAQHNTLILVAPGVYQSTTSDSNRLEYAGKIAIRGLGDVPEDVRFTRRYRNDAQFALNADVVFENIHIQGLNGYYGDNILVYQSAVASTTYSRMYLEHQDTRTDAGTFLENSTYNNQSGPIRFRYSTLHRRYSGATFNCFSGTVINRSRFSFEKTVVSPSLSIYGGSYSGAWANDDYVTASQENYGHQYGDFYIDLVGVPISGRVRDLRDLASPRVVAFKWSDPKKFIPITVSPGGEWATNIPRGHDYGIYYLSRDNRCPPIIHGPYTAE